MKKTTALKQMKEDISGFTLAALRDSHTPKERRDIVNKVMQYAKEHLSGNPSTTETDLMTESITNSIRKLG